jgi:hypothetical protein
MWLKSVDLAFALILLFFTALQFNDPDPLFWIGLYGLAALGPLLTLFRPFNSALFWLGVGYCLAGVTLSLGGGLEFLPYAGQEPLMQAMNPEKPYIEEAREVIGTLIALAMIAIHSFLHRRKLRGQTP